jgi:hypothetical protein
MILTIGPGGSGLTFLNWTIVFLRGDLTYITLDNLSQVVDINPLQGSTAHNFRKDHIQSSSNLCQLAHGNEKSVVYVTPVNQEDFDYVAQFDCKKIVFDCGNRNKELFVRMVTQMPNRKIPDLIDSLAAKFGKNATQQVLLDSSKMFTHYYTIPESSSEYFVISYDDIFNHLDQRIVELFVFLGETIDQSRLTKWLDIYKTYQERNSDLLSKFSADSSDVSNSVKLQILKEVLQWKSGLFPSKCTN